MSDFCRAMLCKRSLCHHPVSVCVCVCVSVTFVHSVKTNKDIFKIFHYRIATPFYFFHTKRDGDIPTGTPRRGIECRWVGRNRDSEPISGFAASCQRCDRGQVLSTRRRRTATSCDTTAGSSGVVCCSRETSTKCL